MIKILLADDHPLLLEGTKHFLLSKGYTIVGTAFNGNEAYNGILKWKPDVAILDFEMPIMNGLEVAAIVHHNAIQSKIVILSLHKQQAIIQQLNKTIQGYITKDTALEELENCIHTLLRGEIYISPKINESSILTTYYSPDTRANLTPTEIKILKQLALNQNSHQIAESLFISKRTVEKHRSNIIKKLELESSPNALFIWIKNHPEILEI
ncbi:MAG: response regulator transcription factor [Flavobacteriaceae bacterium]|nr:response regulator transcription factor [Flavobacteriaceae bacterium]